MPAALMTFRQRTVSSARRLAYASGVPPVGMKPEIREAIGGYVAGYNAYLREIGGRDGVDDPALLCELIRKVHSENGGTYIVITHDIASARRLGEYIAVLWKGRIVESGDAERMFESENPFVRQFLQGEADGPLGME